MRRYENIAWTRRRSEGDVEFKLEFPDNQSRGISEMGRDNASNGKA